MKLPITELITCNCSFIAKLWAENYFQNIRWVPLKKGLNLGERPKLLFQLLKSVLFDMCLLSESVDQLNNVIVNKGTELFILAPYPVC